MSTATQRPAAPTPGSAAAPAVVTPEQQTAYLRGRQQQREETAERARAAAEASLLDGTHFFQVRIKPTPARIVGASREDAVGGAEAVLKYKRYYGIGGSMNPEEAHYVGPAAGGVPQVVGDAPSAVMPTESSPAPSAGPGPEATLEQVAASVEANAESEGSRRKR